MVMGSPQDSIHSVKLWFGLYLKIIHHRQIPGASVLLKASISSYFEVYTKPHNCITYTMYKTDFRINRRLLKYHRGILNLSKLWCSTITSTSFTSNSSVFARQGFPYVSDVELDPFNLKFKNTFIQVAS